MFSEFNTQNVIDMSYMFSNCSSLNELNLSFFNTEKINDISYMFFNCFSLGKNYFLKIEINKIITKNMFFGCDN